MHKFLSEEVESPPMNQEVRVESQSQAIKKLVEVEKKSMGKSEKTEKVW